MASEKKVILSQQECDLLNGFRIPLNDLQFLKDPNDQTARPDFVKGTPDGCKSIFNNAEDTHTRTIYKGLYNRIEVIIKEVKLTREEAGKDGIPTFFVAGVTALKPWLYRLLREVTVGLSLPKHGNLCQVYNWAVDPTSNATFYVVMERFDGSLTKLVRMAEAEAKKAHEKMTSEERRENGGLLGWPRLVFIAIDVAEGLRCFNSFTMGVVCGTEAATDPHEVFSKKSCIHRDLKPDNFFIEFEPEEKGQPDPNGPTLRRVAIGDFGTARVEAKDAAVLLDNPVTQGRGTPLYRAPEALHPDRFRTPNGVSLTPAMDIYSFGIVLWRLLHYPDCPGFDEEWSPQRPGPIKGGALSDMYDIIKECTAQDPTKRPSIEVVYGRLKSFAEMYGERYEERLATNTTL